MSRHDHPDIAMATNLQPKNEKKQKKRSGRHPERPDPAATASEGETGAVSGRVRGLSGGRRQEVHGEEEAAAEVGRQPFRRRRQGEAGVCPCASRAREGAP